MKVLGLDSATFVTGWAVINADGPSGSGFTLGPYGRILIPKRRTIGDRLVQFRDLFSELLDTHKPDRVYYEDTYIRFIKAARPLIKVTGIIEMVVWEKMNEEALYLHPSSVRNMIGCTSKAGARDWILRQFGVSIPKEKLDESDAIAVAWAGAKELMG